MIFHGIVIMIFFKKRITVHFLYLMWNQAMRTSLLLFCAFFLFSITSPVFAAPPPTGDKTVEAEGFGTSPADALMNAKRQAVEEGIGVVLLSQTEVENFLLKKDTVITQTVGAVKSYDVLKESQDGTSSYVKIRAVVSLDSITADLMALKILLISMDKPRTMVLVQEEGGRNGEATIIDYLQQKGFELVDPAQTAALQEKDDPFIRQAIAGDPLAAAKLGADNGAEYIVVGSVRKNLLNNDFINSAGMKSGQASITVKVVNCSNGRLIATKTATGAAVHIADDIAKGNASIKAATNLMDEKLFEAIVASFQDTVNNGANYDVLITGVTNYRAQKNLTQLLERTDGVITVTKRSYGSGKLALSVMFKGNVDAFCDRIDGKPLGDNTLLVSDVTGNRVGLLLQ